LPLSVATSRITRVRDVLVSGLVTGYAIAVPVGAVAVLIIAVSSRTTRRTGAAAGLGVATIDGIYATVAVLAGTAVANVLEPISTGLQAISVVVLLAIAALTLVHAFRPERADNRALTRWTPLRAWLTFAAITAINPATVLYFAAIVLGGTVRIDGAGEGVMFVVAAFAASASWQLFVASIGTGLGSWISSPRGRRTTGVVATLAIAALALKPLL
jgi:arginine exporter protein ArgO